MLLHFRRFTAGVAAALVMVLTGAEAANAAVQPNGTYSNWFWPATSTGYYNFDQRMTIFEPTTAANYFWSHQFGFIGGDGGYLGLQTGSFPNRTKIALFSIWGANAASGANCGTFVEGTPGYTCRLDPYNWVAGRTYRLRLWAVGADSGGEWWGAWVQDTVTGTDRHIGNIRVPGPWGWLGTWSVSWTEYFGPPLATCAQLPWAFAHFAFPTANNGTVKIGSHQHFINETGGCRQYSRIIEYGGDVQEMGKLGS
ncbi:MAG TPA: DUF3472 domain-containing protein [Candidatus Limnocylindrales bacterium]